MKVKSTGYLKQLLTIIYLRITMSNSLNLTKTGRHKSTGCHIIKSFITNMYLICHPLLLSKVFFHSVMLCNTTQSKDKILHLYRSEGEISNVLISRSSYKKNNDMSYINDNICQSKTNAFLCV